MPEHDPLTRIKHMRDHAAEALQLLGEAASRVPIDFREQHPTCPYAKPVRCATY